MRITLLGTGSSSGVPLIGCDCAVCTSPDPKNRRLRVSVFVELGDVSFLIDTSPDLRQQALRANIRKVDAILYTHAHADHTHGIDECRSFNYLSNAQIPIYGDQATIDELSLRFHYVFLPPHPPHWYRASLVPHMLVPGKQEDILGVTVLPLAQSHGKSQTLGFRIGAFAYVTDTNFLPEETLQALEGVDCLVVDCLSYHPQPSHAHLDLALSWIDRIRPKRAVLTHMNHEFDYETIKAHCPEGVEPGYDGLVIVPK